MVIDNCHYTFAQLATDVLPGHMLKLKQRIKNPTPMSEFAIKGVGVATLLRRFNLTSDFSGCYVFIDVDHPVYVGISQTVFRRLRQHVLGTTHNDATLAYRIATSQEPHNMKRDDAMADEKFQGHFAAAQDYLKRLNVAFIEIQNPVELYIFEAYCAMELGTGKMNTFETH